MSNRIKEPSTGYFGIINGVMYRIDADTGLSERLSGLAPLETLPIAAAGPSIPEAGRHPVILYPEAPATGTVPPAANAAGRLRHAEPAGEETRAEREERVKALFTRDGSEPLRAGHPDLWNLLVSGTCLEGSTFHSPG